MVKNQWQVKVEKEHVYGVTPPLLYNTMAWHWQPPGDARIPVVGLSQAIHVRLTFFTRTLIDLLQKKLLQVGEVVVQLFRLS